MSRSTAQVKPVGKRRIPKVKPKKRTRRPSAVGYSEKIPAAKMKRLMAFAVDEVFVHLIMSAIGVPMGGVGGPILSALYFGAQDATMGAGRSLGRAAVGQRLMSAEGEKLTVVQTVKRNAIRYLLWLLIIPLFIDIGLVLFGDGRTLADRICGTRVWEDPVRVRQRHMAEEKDARSLRRAEAEAWGQYEEEDEFMAAAQAELEQEDYEAAELRRFEAELGDVNDAIDVSAAVVDVPATVLDLNVPEQRPQVETHRATIATTEDHEPVQRESAQKERGGQSKTKPLTAVVAGKPDPSRFSDDELAAQLEALEAAMEAPVERPEREPTMEEPAPHKGDGFSLLAGDDWSLPEMSDDVLVPETVKEEVEEKA